MKLSLLEFKFAGRCLLCDFWSDTLIQVFFRSTFFLNQNMDRSYRKWNNYLGWAVWAIATFVYVMTVEPTVSYWDCGEYIATSVKLQVGHPPGASLFQILGAFFAIFSFGDVTIKALLVNLLSALSSSFTILFLFWTITHLVRKMCDPADLNRYKVLIFGSGVVGALAFTFTDTFWFSAVEAEVYAMATMLIALIFWLALKWEESRNSAGSERWLILIAYLLGLAMGVHFMAILTIPAVCFVYYFNRFKNSRERFILANLIIAAILFLTYSVFFPSILRIFGWLEIFFVNSFGLPFHSGTLVAGCILIAASVFFLKRTADKGKQHWNTIVLAAVFMIIGFSSWLMLPIRANADTPINENDPSDAISLLAYYNREQYGSLPTFYGPYFNAKLDKKEPYKQGPAMYEKNYKTGTYELIGHKQLENWDKKYTGPFPRMHSRQPGNIKNYKSIAGITDDTKKPAFIQNITFFIKYQFNYMFLRYFFWNFVGRQNGQQGRMDIFDGNWLTGVKFIDQLRLGNQDFPKGYKHDKARNVYYGLPLILGLIGVYFHFRYKKKDAYSVLILFAFTGLILIFYTNEKPFEPRERDYAKVGAFYAFAIWIGIGVYGVFSLLKKRLTTWTVRRVSWLSNAACLLLVPVLLAKENWDDHDRSKRYIARDTAKGYLDSCDDDAILFTYGDNDTFPVWYVQEVEGYRTDVKAINLSLFNTDWHIDQAKRKSYDADPVPSQLTHDKYRTGTRDAVYFYDGYKISDRRVSIKEFIRWIARDDKKNKIEGYSGEEVFFPTKKIRIPVDKKAVLENGIVALKDSAQILDYIDIDLKGFGLEKKDILILDIIANNEWKRPVYFTITSPEDASINLSEYLQLEGLTHKFVPIKTPRASGTRVDTERMYKHIQKFDWGNMNDPDVLLDDTYIRDGYTTRRFLWMLAEAFIEEKNTEKAEEVLDLAMDKAPISLYPARRSVLDMLDGYYQIGKIEKARKLAGALLNQFSQKIDYQLAFSSSYKSQVIPQLSWLLSLYRGVVAILDTQDKESELVKEGVSNYTSYQNLMSTKFNL